MPGPRHIVQPPSFTPLPYGLLTTLRDSIRPGDERWSAGVTWESICAQGGTTYDECWSVTGTGEAPPEPTAKSATTEITRRGALPFTVFAEVDCSAPGFWDRAQSFVSDALTQSEQWQVENAIWTGVAGGQSVVWPRLAADAELLDEQGVTLQTGATIVVTGALDVVEGLGALEAALADCYDGVGVIHAPRNLLSIMQDRSLIIREGDQYRTAGGNMVVFGAGYRGTSPSGASVPGQTWMYATGAMFVYRSTARIMPIPTSLNRADNTLRALAERTYLVGWDCCQLAVNISTATTEVEE